MAEEEGSQHCFSNTGAGAGDEENPAHEGKGVNPSET
jgi:hypothetical protein